MEVKEGEIGEYILAGKTFIIKNFEYLLLLWSPLNLVFGVYYGPGGRRFVSIMGIVHRV
jgi:hypothetical protein